MRDLRTQELGRKIFFDLVAEHSDQFREVGFVTLPAPCLTWASFCQLRTWFGWVGVDVRLACIGDGQGKVSRLVLSVDGKNDPHDLQERLADSFWRLQAGQYIH